MNQAWAQTESQAGLNKDLLRTWLISDKHHLTRCHSTNVRDATEFYSSQFQLPKRHSSSKISENELIGAA